MLLQGTKKRSAPLNSPLAVEIRILKKGLLMKQKSSVINYLTWLFALCLLWSGNVFSAELIFKDTQYSFQALRTLGYAVIGGADIGEVLKTAYLIKEGDDESWYREWLKTAEHCEKAGNEFLARGRSSSKPLTITEQANFSSMPGPTIHALYRFGKKAATAS